MSDNKKKHDIPIAVRHLAEKSHRQGGLATPEYGGIDSADGISASKVCSLIRAKFQFMT